MRETPLRTGRMLPAVRTGASNTRPAFEHTSTVVTLNVDENTRAGQDVGSPVSARDDDGHRLSYSLDGPDAASFDINGSTGRIRTRSGVSYDYESKSGYSLTVKVDDRQRKANSVTAKSVTIELRDVDEPPSAPKAPRVTGVTGSTDSIRVTWDEPANTGPPIDYYDVQYGQAGTGGFRQLGLRIEDSSVIITGLTPGTRYDVQVRAWNDEGHGEYSRSGTGAPNADIRNRNPRFSRRDPLVQRRRKHGCGSSRRRPGDGHRRRRRSAEPTASQGRTRRRSTSMQSAGSYEPASP